jgi:hypothetical protein
LPSGPPFTLAPFTARGWVPVLDEGLRDICWPTEDPSHHGNLDIAVRPAEQNNVYWAVTFTYTAPNGSQIVMYNWYPPPWGTNNLSGMPGRFQAEANWALQVIQGAPGSPAAT